MAKKRAKDATERRFAETMRRFEADKQERDRRRADLQGAEVRRLAALDTRREVEAAQRARDPDAALVARLDAERRERLGL